MNYDFSFRWNILKGILFFGILGLIITGCAQKTSPEIPTPVLNGYLTPYFTAIPGPSLNEGESDIIDAPKSTEIPAPTPTPLVYTVVENDTLTGIAFRHSVTLENLIAENPGLDPNFLTIGLTLTIPMEGVISAEFPTSTPVPITLQQPLCYRLAEGSLQCMTVVENDQTFDVENVVVLISLLSPDSDTLSQIAFSPLNIIPAGQKLAVTATFAPPFSQDYLAQASLLSAMPISTEDQRYLQTELQIEAIDISPKGDQAYIAGSIELLPAQKDATVIWVSAFAYDIENNIVGIRKWIADDILIAGDQIRFDLIVYSLELPIEYVEVLTETRP